MTRATPTLIHHALDVNSWTKNDPDVEAARASHCPRCGAAAHQGGRLRLHGHGRRWRSVWGPSEPDGEPVRRCVRLRRYRCTECRTVCTVAPRGIAGGFRYAVAAIASALLLWGVWVWTAARTRAALSPDRITGLCEPQRWRSLSRWARRPAELFGLPEVGGATDREIARRVAHILIARGPPGLHQHRRLALGACAR